MGKRECRWFCSWVILPWGCGALPGGSAPRWVLPGGLGVFVKQLGVCGGIGTQAIADVDTEVGLEVADTDQPDVGG